MAIKPDVTAYLQSITDELNAKASRIRHLIGDRHFLTDGHHKEYVLQSILSRFLPNGLICSRGFVVRDSDFSIVSGEQDLLLVDVATHAPLFNESGVVVTFVDNVRAAISVKSTLNSTSLSQALDGLRTIPVISESQRPWMGVFSFATIPQWLDDPSKPLSKIKKHCDDNPLFGVICSQNLYCDIRLSGSVSLCRAYQTPLSAALFFASLADHLSSPSQNTNCGLNDLLAHKSFQAVE